MAEGKKSFILYADLIHTVKKMPLDKAGKLFVTVLEYVNDENPKVDDIIVDLVFEPIKRQLKRDLESFESVKEERSMSGKIGNLKRWHNDIYEKYKAGKLSLEQSLAIADNRIAIKPIAKIAVNDTVNDTVNDINILFDVFWDAYDKKRNVKKSKAKWESLNDDAREKIMNHVPKYVLSTPDKSKRKDPMTYLNNESWNDEIILSKSGNGSGYSGELKY